MKLLQVDGTTGVVEIGGVTRKADLSLVMPVQAGQYVIVHAGFAISAMNEDEAQKTLALFDELKQLTGNEGIT